MNMYTLHRYTLLPALLMTGSAVAFQSVAFPTTRTTTSRSNWLQQLQASAANNSDNDDNNINNGSAEWTYPPEFHRAIECAKNQGLCDVDELFSLADELEQYDGCFWEVAMTDADNNDDDCEKEFLDRLDIADLLRAEGEMIQRRDTIEFSNLFKERIEKEERGEKVVPPPKEVIDLYSNYYQCVYSKTPGP